MENGNEIDDLIKLISKLPGLGPKSAKRIVLKLINNRDELVKPLAKSLADVYKNISRCKICGALKSISIGKGAPKSSSKKETVKKETKPKSEKSTN